MRCRTDLALEMLCSDDCRGVEHTVEEKDMLRIDRVFVKSKEGEEITGKPVGRYVTITLPSIGDSLVCGEENVSALSEELRKLIPKEGTVLVVGLGNMSVTPDALGPTAVRGILATRHISGEFERIAGLEGLRSVAVLAPGVLGQTGIEVYEIISSLIGSIRPSAVIAIDALAARGTARLGCTIQISDTGISPGAGVGNNRPGLNEKTLGVPVIAIGIPTVVDAAAVAVEAAESLDISDDMIMQLEERAIEEKAGMIVTPAEIDLIVNRAGRLISLAVNLAMHPDYDPEELADAV